VSYADTYNPAQAEGWRGRAVQAVLAEFDAQKDRLILWMPVVLALGVGLYFALPYEPPGFIAPGLLLLTAAVWALLYPLKFRSRPGYAAWLSTGWLALVLLGFCAAQFRAASVSAPMLTREIGTTLVEGRIAGIDRMEEGQGIRLLLDRLVIEDLEPAQTPERIRLRVRQAEGLHIGERVSVLAGIKPPSPPALPGAFDFQRHAYFMKLGGLGFAYTVPEKMAADEPAAFAQKLEILREKIDGRIGAALGGSTGAIAMALMTGARAGITEEDWQALRASGLAHIISISGLHIGLVATFIFMVTRFCMAAVPPLALRYPIKKYAAFIALLGILAYTVIVEFSVPTWRSMLMTGVVLFAVMIDRMPFSLRLLAIAAFAVLLAVPEALTGASFQMSFAAVAALIFCFEQLKPYLSQLYQNAGFIRKTALYFAGACLTTLIATIATAPFSLFHFQQLAVYSLIANVFAVPLTTFVIMPAAVMGFLLMPAGLEEYPLYVMGWGIERMMAIARRVTALPFSMLTPPAVPLAALLCVAGAGLFVMLWNGRARILALVPVLLTLVIIARHEPPVILVSGSAKLVALRDSGGQLWISNARGEKFTAEVWARINGLLPEEVKRFDANPAIACDAEGCRTLWHGRRVAVAYEASAQAEDCAWADVLIALEPLRAPDCRAETVIDFFDLRRGGAHAVWADGSVKSVEALRGKRPWTVD